ncbi:DEAD/DEAH box helicase [Thermaerobacter litoralis]
MAEITVRREVIEHLAMQLEEAAAALRAALDASRAPDKGAARADSTPEPEGTVLFLEPRRQFIVSRPSPRQLEDLATIGHLDYADKDGNYSVVVREQDLWRVAEWDVVDAILRRYAPDHPHFWEWARQAWDRRNVFAIEDGPDGRYLVLRSRSEEELAGILRREAVRKHLYAPNRCVGGLPAVRIKQGADGAVHRHALKRVLLGLGYPVADRARLAEGEPVAIRLRPDVEADPRWDAYQRRYVEEAYRLGAAVLFAPPGAGKTVVALGLVCKCQTSTLILTPQRELAEQWRREIAQKTTWPAHQIGLYHGGAKRIAPITVATYTMAADPAHQRLFDRPWGLIVFDECHHLPAPFFRQAARFQAIRRLGLTASPVREDGREKDIWALIGPPIGGEWGRLFAGGFVAQPEVELWRLPLPETARQAYRRARGIRAVQVAAMNPAKIEAARRILAAEPGAKALLFVEWVEHGQAVAQALGLPFVWGETPHAERERLYADFRAGRIRALVVSRVGNQGLDLPDAELALMLSWHGGSRQEGTQRTGRIMRPKDTARAVYLVSAGTAEEDFARRQVQLLREQGVSVRETALHLG